MRNDILLAPLRCAEIALSLFKGREDTTVQLPNTPILSPFLPYRQTL
jgi:hypothetical protein